MNIELKKPSPVKREMTVEVDAQTVAEETEKVLRSYARKAEIPGFRRGKAPLSVIRGRFAEEVRTEVREQLVRRYFLKAVEEQELSPLGDPILDEVKDEPGDGLTFQVRFEVPPEITLKNHKGVEVRRPPVTVTDQDVGAALEELRQSQAKLVTEEGREARTGDVAVVDIVGIPDEGEKFERERMFLEIGSTDNLPAFNEKMLGAVAGAELAFPVDYPKEYATEQLAGKRVEYSVKIHEVKRRDVPELDDEFAKDLGDFGSLDELRGRIREDLLKRRKLESERAIREAVMDKVLLANPVVLPDTLVEGEIRYRLEELVRRLIAQGMDPETVQLDWNEMRKQQEEPARRSVHTRLLLDAVARSESIVVTDEEIEERLRRDAEALGQNYEKFRAEVRKREGMEVLKSQMVREKSLDLLTAVANIQNEE